MRHVINYRIHVWKMKGIGELLLVSLDRFIVIIFFCYPSCFDMFMCI